MHLVLHLLRLVRALAADRTRLALEKVVLRQQFNALRRYRCALIVSDPRYRVAVSPYAAT